MNLHNEIEYKKLKCVAKKVTREFNRKDLYDDFLQYASEEFLKGRTGSIKQVFIDFIRNEFGDSRHNSSRSIKFSKTLEWEGSMDVGVIDTHMVDFNNVISNFRGIERSILVLYYEWDFTMKEIGNVLGISEGRVSQVYKELSKKLNRRFGNA